MKLRILMLSMAICLLGLTGCSTAGLAKLTRELAKDPATVNMKVNTPWGSMTLERSNPGFGPAPVPLARGVEHRVMVAPDGTVTVRAVPAGP